MHRGKLRSPVPLPVIAASIFVVVAGAASRPVVANPAQFPRPPQLEPDVKFLSLIHI